MGYLKASLHLMGVWSSHYIFEWGGSGGPVWPLLAKNAIFGKCSDWLETPLKRCASTRAFEWSGSRVIWRSWSKVMAKLPCGKMYWEKWGRNVMDYIFGGIHWTPSKAVVVSVHHWPQSTWSTCGDRIFRYCFLFENCPSQFLQTSQGQFSHKIETDSFHTRQITDFAWNGFWF